MRRLGDLIVKLFTEWYSLTLGVLFWIIAGVLDNWGWAVGGAVLLIEFRITVAEKYLLKKWEERLVNVAEEIRRRERMQR